MRLGISPLAFLARLLVILPIIYFLWTPVAPYYTRLLATLTEGFLHLTESSSDPNLHHVTVMQVQNTDIFFQHRLFPQVHPSAIEGDWVQANLVLLIPFMLATPAPTYRKRFTRLALALLLALALQVLDLAVTVKAFYAHRLGTYSAYYYSGAARTLYGFGYAFTYAMDNQLFPFAIWAGIHFNQLLGRQSRPATPVPVTTLPPSGAPGPRRKRKAASKAAGRA
jgi:hypothetical protein